MRLLISVKDVNEVEDAVVGGADIIDIKDPSNGSLGLPDLSIVKDVVDTVRSKWGKEVSIALGDISREDKALKYIVFVGGLLGVDYVKIGLALNNIDMAIKIARDAIDVLSSFSKTKLVLAGYADFMYVGTLDPLSIVDVATKVGAKGVMIDTLRKNGLSSLDLLSTDYLQSFARKAHSENLIAAIAGSIKLTHLPLCARLGFDVIGVRGAVCTSGRGGRVSRELVSLFKMELTKLTEGYHESL